MPLSFYEAVVPAYLQILRPIKALVYKAEKFAADRAIPATDLTMARFADDMKPFSMQLKYVAEHSAGALAGLREGVFTPDVRPAPDDFASLAKIIDDAIMIIERIDPAEMNEYADKDMRFEFGEKRIYFTGQNYFFSFAQPNFYFHATTAYDLLRWKGVPLSKPDYWGELRLKA